MFALLCHRVLLSTAIFRPIIGRIMESKIEEKVEIKNEHDI
jgi:hypothetical protein